MGSLFRGLSRLRLFIFLIVLLVSTISAVSNTVDFLPRSATAIATVAGETTTADLHGRTLYCPQLSIPSQGAVEFSNHTLCTIDPYLVGERLPIRYLASDPSQDIRLNTFMGVWGYAGIVLGISLIVLLGLLIYGILVAVKMVDEDAPLASAQRSGPGGLCYACAHTNSTGAAYCVACGSSLAMKIA